MKRSSRLRKTANLSDSVHHQLNMYALAASAAGVGVLCLAKRAEARIVYTPADVKIPQNSALAVDLNHDGLPDFWLIRSYFVSNSGYPHAELSVQPKRLNGVWDGKPCTIGFVCAKALPKGKTIGPNNGQFKPYPAFMVDVSRVYQLGQWWLPGGEEQAYVGLTFFIKGQQHYGWGRVKVQTESKSWLFTATLTGYAYETTPGKPIIAGATKGPDDAEPAASLNPPTLEHATLGALAMGAPGLSIWRRKESANALS